MSEGLNRVMLLGNISEPELRTTTGGQAVLKLRLAVSESYLDRNKARQERTEWVSVVVWGKRGEALSRILTKGSRVFVEGALRTSSYDDKEGGKRYRTEVVASNIILGGGGAPGGTSRAVSETAERPATPGGGYSEAEYAPSDDDSSSFPF